MNIAPFLIRTVVPVTSYEDESILKSIEYFLERNNLESYSSFNLFLYHKEDKIRFVLKSPVKFKESDEVELIASIQCVHFFEFMGKGESCAKAVVDAFNRAKSEPMIKELSSQFDEDFIRKSEVASLFDVLIDLCKPFEEVWNEYLQNRNE